MGYWQQKYAAVGRARDKKTVSTKGIFNKPERDPFPELGPRARKVSKTSKPGISHRHPTRKSALSTNFSDTVEASREHISEAGAADIEATRNGLLQRLENMNIQYDQEEQALTDSMANLHLPFKNEQIEFRSEDGKQSGVVNLNHRMKKVQKTVNAEAVELERQWEEWLANEAEIESLANEFTIPETTDEMNEEIRLAWEQMLEDEVEASRAHFEKMVEETVEKSIEDMTECEKAFRIDQQKMQDTFTAMLYDEEMWVG